MDVGSSGPPSAPAGINARSSGNPTTVRPASALDYQAYAQTPTQHVVVHNNTPVGYVHQYTDPGHGPLWAATLADHVHALNTHRPKTQPGFVEPTDAAQHIADAHRDVAQIENVGSWRPVLGAGPNMPGH